MPFLDELRGFPELPLDETDVYTPQGCAVFIRPYMVSNIYGMLDFWLKILCEDSANLQKLPLTYKDIKGNNDLDVRHKYLAKVAGLDLTGIDANYQHMAILRDIRICLLHAGGHVMSS